MSSPVRNWRRLAIHPFPILSNLWWARLPVDLSMTLERMDAAERLWRWYDYVDWSPAIPQANRIHYRDKCHSKSPYCNHCLDINSWTAADRNCHTVAEDLYLWWWCRWTEYFGFCVDYVDEGRVCVNVVAASYAECIHCGPMHLPFSSPLHRQKR